jgi:hypothetical protein
MSATSTFVDRHAAKILGTRLFDDPRFAEPFRDEIRENADWLAREHGLEIKPAQELSEGGSDQGNPRPAEDSARQIDCVPRCAAAAGACH